MRFSYSKQTLLRPQKEKWFSTFLIALATAAAFFVPYIILGKGYFIFYGDFNAQQIPFYQMCHEAVKSGNISWNWLTDLGANFIGSYSFYLLGSPFFWMTIPFPNYMIPYLMGPLLILKFSLAALTAYFYIRRFTRTPDAARLGGILYAFSGFSIYNIFFNHFHEPIIFFPLLLLSLELLITENRRGIFALSVCICSLVNYFFFFGMVVFTVIYFFVRLLSGAVKVRFARFLCIVFEAVLGVLLSAFLLLPSLLAIIDNSRISSTMLGWSAILYGKEQIYLNVLECFFFPPDIPARPVFFPEANVKWSSLGGWLPLFSMVGVFTWFKVKTNTWLKRVIGICIFMSLVPVLNSAFYAFNTAYYARWFYMPILMMCLATVSLTEEKDINWSYGFKWVTGITITATLVIGFFPQKDDEGKIIYGLYSQSDDNMYAFRFWITCAIALLSLLVLYLVLKLIKTNAKKFYRTATAFVCIFTIIYANFFVASGQSHSYDIEDVMIDRLIEGEVDLKDDGDFRIDVYDGVDNTGMYLGYSSINAFHSVVPASVSEFYEYIGIDRTVASRPSTEYTAIRPLLSVKYLLNRTDGDGFVDEDGVAKMQGYTYKETSGGYYVYENDNYIPYGFSYQYYMDSAFCENYSESNRASLMLKAILLNDEQIEKYGALMKNISVLEAGGIYSGDDTTTLSLTDEALSYDCEQLSETAADSFEISNSGFKATVSRNYKNLVFFSVPFDEGWKATVNGKEVPIERVNVGFMAVAVERGESIIEFTYETPGLALGLRATALSAVLFLIYILISHIYLKHRFSDTEYPEGEILLSKWQSADIKNATEELNSRSNNEEPPRRSILDDDIRIDIPHLNRGFEGGFKIDENIFNKSEKDNTNK